MEKKENNFFNLKNDDTPIRGEAWDDIKEFGPLYGKVLSFIWKGYKKFIFKGSRGSRKTNIIIKFCIKKMIKDPQASIVWVMETKKEHSETTMREMDEWIEKYNNRWWNFNKKWVKVDNQMDKKYYFYRGKHIQEIKCISWEELARAGKAPLPNNYYAILWCEEPTNSKEQFGIEADKKKERYDAIKTFELTALRFLTRIKRLNFETKRNYEKRLKEFEAISGILKFFSFNPYNAEEPLLENFHNHLEDNEEILEKDGYQFFANETEKEIYLTTNYKINPFLPQPFIDEMELLKTTNPDYYKIVGLGMTGQPLETVYSDIWRIVERNEKSFYQRPQVLTNFFISIDVGNGGAGNMSILLVGIEGGERAYVLEEWDDEEWKRLNNGYDSEKITQNLFKKMSEWERKYPELTTNPHTQIIIDNDIHFATLFKKVYKELLNTGLFELYGNYTTHLFIEKYKKDYKNEDRPAIVKACFSTQRLIINRQWTPKIYKQLKNTRAKENGKIIDGNDDLRQCLEMFVFFNAPKMLSSAYINQQIFDKNVINFLLKHR